MSILSQITGQDARKHANDASAKQASTIQDQLDFLKGQRDLGTKYQSTLLDSLYNDITNFNPTDVAKNNPNFDAARSSFDRNADNAVNSVYDDFAERGFSMPSNGQPNPGVAAAVGNIRSNEASDYSGWLANAITQNEQAKRAGMSSLLGISNGLVGGSDSGISGSIGELGGLAGMYQNQANNSLVNLNGFAKLASDYYTGGMASKSKRGPNAGNNNLGTNQTPSMNYYGNDGGYEELYNDGAP